MLNGYRSHWRRQYNCCVVTLWEKNPIPNHGPYQPYNDVIYLLP